MVGDILPSRKDIVVVKAAKIVAPFCIMGSVVLLLVIIVLNSGTSFRWYYAGAGSYLALVAFYLLWKPKTANGRLLFTASGLIWSLPSAILGFYWVYHDRGDAVLYIWPAFLGVCLFIIAIDAYNCKAEAR